MTTPLVQAALDAPPGPGVYFFLAADGALLYIGKAANLRRRIRDHARAGRSHRVHAVRWQECADIEEAFAREAELIAALRPAHNRAHRDEKGWPYVVIAPGSGKETIRFALTPTTDGAAGRVYGCFAHLGKGLASHTGVRCNAGYTALLRLLWMAAPGDAAAYLPRRISGSSPPVVHEADVAPDLQPALHNYFSGRSGRLLPRLYGAALDHVPAYMRPGVERDLHAATRFFEFGPRAVRSFRLRHGLPTGAVHRAVAEQLLEQEVRDLVGDPSA